jgi:hypothetical protein
MLKTYLRDLKGTDKDENKAIRYSIHDVRKGKFGIHNTYKPGGNHEYDILCYLLERRKK